MMPHANRSSGRLSTSLASLLTDLSAVVGATNVLTKPSQQQSYTQGAIASITDAVAAVVIPDSLVALWRVINLCAAADVIIIAQAANTGLTGGSTPYGEYDRAVVVISMQRLGGVHLLNDAAELVALPAASLQQLESQLAP